MRLLLLPARCAGWFLRDEEAGGGCTSVLGRITPRTNLGASVSREWQGLCAAPRRNGCAGQGSSSPPFPSLQTRSFQPLGLTGAAQRSCLCGQHPPTAGFSYERSRARRIKPCFCPGKQPLCEHSLSEQRAFSPTPPSPHAFPTPPVPSRAPTALGRLCRDARGSAGAAADLFSSLWRSPARGVWTYRTTTVGAAACSAFWEHTKAAAALPSAAQTCSHPGKP